MTTLRMAWIIARATVRLVDGDRRIVLLGEDEEGRGYRLVVVQGQYLMERSFDSCPDAFARFLDYANGVLVCRNDVLLPEFPEGVDAEIKRLPPQEELRAAWERIGGKIREEEARGDS
jgi:hypothetical protein